MATVDIDNQGRNYSPNNPGSPSYKCYNWLRAITTFREIQIKPALPKKSANCAKQIKNKKRRKDLHKLFAHQSRRNKLSPNICLPISWLITINYTSAYLTREEIVTSHCKRESNKLVIILHLVNNHMNITCMCGPQ